MNCNNYTTHKIKTLNQNIRKEFDKQFEHLGITGQQGIFLIYVSHNDKVHQNDIEQTFGLSKSTVSGIIKRMVKKEIISKQSDYPYVSICATEKGKKLVEKMDEVRNKINEKLLTGFSNEEKNLINNFISRMIENMKEEE